MEQEIQSHYQMDFTRYATKVEEFYVIKAQVLKYGVFYIGRYEAGINSTIFRTGTTTVQLMVCKKEWFHIIM